MSNPTDAAVLGESRLREVYYAVLKGEAGATARRAFGVGNEIARVIEHVSSHLDEPITIDDMAAHVGYASSSQFSREFKRTCGQSPKQWSRIKQPLPAGLM